MITTANNWLLAVALTLSFTTAAATIILETPVSLSVHDVLIDNIVLMDPDAALSVGEGGVVGPVRAYQGFRTSRRWRAI